MKRLSFFFAILLLSGCQSGSDAAPSDGADPSTESAGSGETAAAGDEAAGSGENADDGANAAVNDDAPENTGDNLADPTATPPDVAAPPANAEVTASGLASLQIHPGVGSEHPSERDTVRVHYSGWTTDGENFDSSYSRNEPTEFPLNRVIPGWTEGLQLMTVGEKRRFWIPVELAYNNRPGAPAGMLVFDVLLMEIMRAPEPPSVPEDVAAIPENAVTTSTGLASRVLRAGDGAAHPTAASQVTVHYSGWTTDGQMFDSSVERGQPATFPLGGVIAGWTEGLQLMVVGEKRRFWIPVELAYNNRPGAPAGMLVFDVELLSFE